MKNKIFLLFLILLCVSLVSACIPFHVTGSGNLVSRTFDFTDFTRVKIRYGFMAEIKASTTYTVEVTADDNIFDYILVRKDGDILSVGLKPGSYERSQLQATIMMPNLKGIELSDGGRTRVSGFNSSDNLSIKLSDGTNLSGKMVAGNVDISLADGSHLELEGSAKNIKVISHDGSQAYLENFSVTNADLSVGDGSTLTIDVNGTLNVSLSAGSHVSYTGNPSLGTIKLSGGSTLSKKE